MFEVSFQWFFFLKFKIFIQENAIENVICKMQNILLRAVMRIWDKIECFITKSAFEHPSSGLFFYKFNSLRPSDAYMRQ